MHDKNGVIGSTGPDMTRYFSKVDDAVNLVITAIENIDQLQGSVLSRAMKSALIRDILDLWIREKGGRWEKIEGRPGDRPHEFLVGEPELPFTKETSIDGVPHYVTKFNHPVSTPLATPFTSATAERLSENELLDFINSPPAEEI